MDLLGGNIMAISIDLNRAREIADEAGQKVYKIYEKYFKEMKEKIEKEAGEYMESTLGLNFASIDSYLPEIETSEDEIAEEIYFGLTEGDSIIYEVSEEEDV